MARKTKTTLTFQVTIPSVVNATIPEIRQFIKQAIVTGLDTTDNRISFDVSNLRIHLTNKETSYA